jgi:hypothetical protein
MDVGSIGFHNKGNVKRILVEKDKEIVKRINKTKQVLKIRECTLSEMILNPSISTYRKDFQIWQNFSRNVPPAFEPHKKLKSENTSCRSGHCRRNERLNLD